MFTRCPSCQTVFRVRPEMLRVAHGQVRCGRCDALFNALDSLAEYPDGWAVPTGALAPAEEVLAETPPDGACIDDGGIRTGSPAGEVTSAPAAERPGDDSGIAALAVADVPCQADGSPAAALRSRASGVAAGLDPAVLQDFLLQEEADPSGRWRRRGWLAASMGLLILLAGQWIYLQRAYLYEFSAARPALHKLCAVLDCALPLARAPDRIDVLQRVVRAHPRVARALLVDLSFVSRAERPIAYPILELRLADVSGNRVAARRFTPVEYLTAGSDPGRGLPPDQPVHVSLELVAPRTDVVSFQFEFL